jgi:hypothetical protein
MLDTFATWFKILLDSEEGRAKSGATPSGVSASLRMPTYASGAEAPEDHLTLAHCTAHSHSGSLPQGLGEARRAAIKPTVWYAEWYAAYREAGSENLTDIVDGMSWDSPDLTIFLLLLACQAWRTFFRYRVRASYIYELQ